MGKPQPSAPPPPYDIYPTTRRRPPEPWREPEPLGWVDRHPHWATLLIAVAVAVLTAIILLLGS